MRIRTTIADLSETQWRLINETVRTEYQFGERNTRVCVIFKRGSEERHTEMPLANYVGVLVGLGMASPSQAYMAALAASIPPEEAGPPCEHGAPIARVTPSAFKGAKSSVTYADGCQSYGPYKMIEASAPPEEMSPLGPKWNQEYQNRTGDRLPRLPTADQVRNLSSAEAVELARQMNAPEPVVDRLPATAEEALLQEIAEKQPGFPGWDAL